MGIKDNFRKIREYQKYRSMESKMNRDVAKQSRYETDFYSEYSSFVTGLKSKLQDLLNKENHSEVVFKPVDPDKAKYFERVMLDEEFTTVYIIKRTVGGEYSFQKKLLDDALERTEIEDYL